VNNAQTDGLEHFADLTVTPFGDCEFDDGIPLLGGVATKLTGWFIARTCAKLVKLLFAYWLVCRGDIGFWDFRAWMRYFSCELSVVGEDE